MPDAIVTSAHEPNDPGPRIDLWSLLVIAAALAFITALIVLTDRLSPAWLFFVVPIVIAGLTHDVPGAVLTAAIATALTAVAAPAGSLGTAWPELVAGASVFLLTGAVIGAQSKRRRSHAEQLELASTTDPLTGLLKTEHFGARLNEEIRRADRYESDLGLVLARIEDIEGFTRVFGRYKAQLVLEHLAGIVRLTVRDTDVIGRVGPSTYAIALPHADRAAAQRVAERIRQAMATAEVEGDALEPVTTCRTATAAASFPDEAGSQEALLRLARERLEGASHATTDVSSAPGWTTLGIAQ